MKTELVDALIICPKCACNICYQIHFDSIIKWQCFGCGYTSNSSMIKNTDVVKSFEETLPRLILDLKFIDKEGFVWYPTVIDTIADGGYMIFPDGTSNDDWAWALTNAVLIDHSERTKFKKPDGTYMKYKANTNILHFPKENFAEAVDAANLI